MLDELRAAGGNAAAEILPLDLGDFDSVRQCAQTFLARGLPLHLLINNAGLAGARGLTKSGFELAFGTNHLGHFLLTQLLMDRIKASAPARIVPQAGQETGLCYDRPRPKEPGKPAPDLALAAKLWKRSEDWVH